MTDILNPKKDEAILCLLKYHFVSLNFFFVSTLLPIFIYILPRYVCSHRISFYRHSAISPLL